jgi:TonB family protein
MSASKIILLYSLLLAALTARADFNLGASYYAQGNFEKAYQEFLEASAYGDHDAQNNIGAMYYRGEFLPKDKISAYAWLALATQAKNYLDANVHLKIYNKMSDDEKKLANEKYKMLFDEYSNQAIQNKLTPQLSTQIISAKKQRLLKTFSPSYPQDLAQRQISGFVDVIFTIDKNGTTRDQMVYYTPEKAFGKAALNALRRFQYEPLIINGAAVDVSGIKMRFVFSMDGAEYNIKKLNKIVDEKREKANTGSSKDKFMFGYFLESIPSYVKDYKLTDNPNEWYTNAANDGNNSAAYFLGRNILYGNMCTANSTQSMGWLLKAAKAGITEAEYLLAIESFSGAKFEKNEEKGFYWLGKAAKGNKFARVKYAWILATHPDAKYRNAKLAQEWLALIDEDYIDKQNLYQTQAAAAAEAGNFEAAIKWQNKALEDAKELELPLTQVEQRLASYTNKTAWREAI